MSSGIGFLNRSDVSSLTSGPSLCDDVLNRSTLELERAVNAACADVAAWAAAEGKGGTMEVAAEEEGEAEVPYAVARAIERRFKGKARAEVGRKMQEGGDAGEQQVRLCAFDFNHFYLAFFST